MIRRPPRATRTYTLFPDTTLFRSDAGIAVGERGGILTDLGCVTSDENVYAVGECAAVEGRCYGLVAPGYTTAEIVEIGRAHVCTPVTNAHIVCRLLLDNKKVRRKITKTSIHRLI